MRDVSASATGLVQAPVERCYELLSEVERYPDWYAAAVKRVEVLDRDDEGRAASVDTLLSLGTGPIRKDFPMKLGVVYDSPARVELSRLPEDAKDGESVTVIWTLEPAAAEQTALTVAFAATLDVPPFLPINGIVDAVAEDFLAAARAGATASS